MAYQTRRRFVHWAVWLPESNPLRNRSRGSNQLANPKIWFRIVHVTLDDANESASYREQTVEVTLGPDWAFETGGLGSLTRRVPANQVVTAVPERVRVKPPKPPRESRTPPVVETLRKALAWQRELDAGEVASQAELARREGITRARVTQVLMLIRLAPDIQEAILAIKESLEPPGIGEWALRPITRMENPKQQVAAFKDLLRAALPERI